MIRCGALAGMALLVGLAAGLSGCSGTGAPAVPGEVETLRSIANDQVTAVLLLRRWFSILHVREAVSATGRPTASPSCLSDYHPLPPRPGDPPGTECWEGVMSDCTVVKVYRFPDGSMHERFDRTDGSWSEVDFSADRMEGTWRVRDVQATHSDQSSLAYKQGFDTWSALNDQYVEGSARLPDGRTMQFRHDRNHELDSLALAPDDGARLQVEVPLTAVAGSAYWPVFGDPAQGRYTSPTGAAYDFTVGGTGDTLWDTWEFRLRDGTTGAFTAGDDLSTGTGRLLRGGGLLATLSWQAGGQGTLQPVGASAVSAVPSAAARDFAIDQWIRNIAALGPMPMY
jgi:hypothetical protein